MYGGSKAPFVLPNYATDYVIHKLVVKQLYINGFENSLFDMKKAIYPPLPFCIAIYTFSKVKSAPDFMRELEIFHFREKCFRRNDPWDKVSKHSVYVGVHFEYTNHKELDEEIY